MGCIPVLKKLLDRPYLSETQHREVCWMLSNITSGTQNQIQMVVDHGLIPSLVTSGKHHHYPVRKEALWALSNATCNASLSQIKLMVTQGVIELFCSFLDDDDIRMIA